MRVVIDTNIIIYYLYNNKMELDTFFMESTICAPLFIQVELGQVLWKLNTNSKKSQSSKIHNKLITALNLIDEFYSEAEIAKSAMDLSFTFDHSYYDSIFLALAQNLNCPIFSYDKKILTIANKLGIETIDL